MINFIFDVDDTLYDQHKPFIDAYNSLGYNLLDIDGEEMFKKTRLYGDEVFEKVNSGEMSIDESGVYRLKKAFNDFKIDLSDEKALELQVTYRHNLANISLSKKMEEFLSTMNPDNISILTNGPYDHQFKKIKSLHLDKYFNESRIFISGLYDFSKPDKRMFDEVINKLNLNKDETYFVGDSYNNDICGAINANLKAIWFNRRLNEERDIKPTYCVTSEEELIALIKQLIKDYE